MSFLHGFVVLSGGQAANSAFVLLARVLLARWLGPALMGSFGLALNVVSIASRWLSIGIAPAAQYQASSRVIPLPVLLRTAGALMLGVGVLATLAFRVAGPYLSMWFTDQQATATTAMQHMALFLPLLMLALVFAIVLLARDEFLHYSLTQTIPSALFVVVLVGGSRLNRGLHAAVWAQEASWVAMLLLACWFLRSFWKGGHLDARVARQILWYGLRAWPVGILQLGISRLAVVVGGRMVSPTELDYYVVAIGVSETLQLGYKTLGQLLFNRTSRAGAEAGAGTGADASALLLMRLSTWVFLVTAVGIAVAGRPIFVFFLGTAYGPAWPTVLALLGAAWAHVITGLQINYLSGRGNPEYAAFAQGTELVTLAVLVPPMARSYGALGLGVGGAVAAIAGLACGTWLIRKRIPGSLVSGVFALKPHDFAILRSRLARRPWPLDGK